jgi:hypothetical protein
LVSNDALPILLLHLPLYLDLALVTDTVLSQLKHQNDERIHDRILLPPDTNSDERLPKVRDTSIR